MSHNIRKIRLLIFQLEVTTMCKECGKRNHHSLDFLHCPRTSWSWKVPTYQGHQGECLLGLWQADQEGRGRRGAGDSRAQQHLPHREWERWKYKTISLTLASFSSCSLVSLAKPSHSNFWRGFLLSTLSPPLLFPTRCASPAVLLQGYPWPSHLQSQWLFKISYPTRPICIP